MTTANTAHPVVERAENRTINDRVRFEDELRRIITQTEHIENISWNTFNERIALPPENYHIPDIKEFRYLCEHYGTNIFDPDEMLITDIRAAEWIEQTEAVKQELPNTFDAKPIIRIRSPENNDPVLTISGIVVKDISQNIMDGQDIEDIVNDVVSFERRDAENLTTELNPDDSTALYYPR